MVCRKPFRRFRCGQCMPCRISRRRLDTHRILLESFLHKFNSFVTLTYDERHLPEGGALKREHTQLWLKKLRDRVSPARIRYYGVGEYGDQTWRPHYHVALFGFPSCSFGVPSYSRPCSCKPCSIIRDSWGMGFTFNALLERKSAQYIAGYVTKKLTKKGDVRLCGRPPEFPFRSLKPGIGAGAMAVVADGLVTDSGAESIIRSGDVPMTLIHGKSPMPLGRYLRRKLRERMGFKEIGAQEGWLSKLSSQEVADYEAWEEKTGGFFAVGKHYQDVIFEERMQKVLNIETKEKVFSKRGGL